MNECRELVSKSTVHFRERASQRRPTDRRPPPTLSQLLHPRKPSEKENRGNKRPKKYPPLSETKRVKLYGTRRNPTPTIQKGRFLNTRTKRCALLSFEYIENPIF